MWIVQYVTKRYKILIIYLNDLVYDVWSTSSIHCRTPINTSVDLIDWIVLVWTEKSLHQKLLAILWRNIYYFCRLFGIIVIIQCLEITSLIQQRLLSRPGIYIATLCSTLEMQNMNFLSSYACTGHYKHVTVTCFTVKNEFLATYFFYFITAMFIMFRNTSIG